MMQALDVLNLYQLRVFVALVEQGSFSGAARALHITQPAVSAQVRHLRAFVGDPLVVRDGRRFTLTEQGRVLYGYAQEVLGATDALRRRIEDMAAGEREHIVIAGSLAYVAYVLPAVLSSFYLQHPRLRLSVQEMLSRETLEHVRLGRADLGVLVSDGVPRDQLDNLVIGPLFTDEMVVVESTERPYSDGQPLSLSEVARYPFVGLARGERLGDHLLNRALVAAGLEAIQQAIDFSAWAGTVSAVRSGVGMAVVFRSVVRRELARGKLRIVPVEGFHAPARVVLICSPRRRESRNSAVFDGLIAHLLREVPAEVAP